MTRSFKCYMKVVALALGIVAAAVGVAGAQPATNDHTVLILGGTVSGGTASLEATMAIAAGMDVEVVTDAQWAAKSASDFASYRALILGDPTCGAPGAPSIAVATANASVWGPAVDGPVVIVGTDPTFHQGQGGVTLVQKGVAFAVSDAANTGAYITLSCYYHGVLGNTPVPLLSAAFGGTFTVTGVGCFNEVHIVATHPALDGLTDESLSNWGCSVHEAFDAWPLGFEVLVLAITGEAYTAPDGTEGTPYIIARGVDVISDITLEPREDTNPIGTPHTLTATVERDDAPVAGVTVTFAVIDGPHQGTTGTGVTNAAGEATFTYTGIIVGTDLIEATFFDDQERQQRSNRVTKVWVGEGGGGDDDEAPAIKCPSDAVLDCAGPGGTVVEYVVVVDDDVDPSPTLVCTPPSGSVFPAGTTTVTCTATDDSGNSSECSFTVTITGGGCPRSQGHWKNHAEAWPVTSLTLGDRTYGQSALLGLLGRPVRGDASLILAKQLIAAKLNLGGCAGAEDVGDWVDDADALIGDRALPLGIKTSTSAGGDMVWLAGKLESFNTGALTPDCKEHVRKVSDKIGSDIDANGDASVDAWEARLLQNRPNPFGRTTSIGFALARPATVRIAVFDVQGREVRVLADGAFGSGEHTTAWDGTDARGRRVPTGVYLYRMDVEGQRLVQRMVLSD